MPETMGVLEQVELCLETLEDNSGERLSNEVMEAFRRCERDMQTRMAEDELKKLPEDPYVVTVKVQIVPMGESLRSITWAVESKFPKVSAKPHTQFAHHQDGILVTQRPTSVQQVLPLKRTRIQDGDD